MEKYSDILDAAKKEYKKTGIIDSRKACILLNCKPTAEIISMLIENLNLSEKVKEESFILLKQCERNWGKGKYLNHKAMAGAIIYICAIKNREKKSQGEITKHLDITTATLRTYKNKIIRALGYLVYNYFYVR